jgi:glutamine cyclotransferase
MKKIVIAITTIGILALIIGITAITVRSSNTSTLSQTPTASIKTPSSPIFSDSPTQQPTFNGVPLYSYKILQTYPHNPLAFTQGLTFDDNGNLIESTGLNGASSIRRGNLTNGQVIQQFNLPYEYFGEGLTIVNNKIIQLTWQNKIGFIYDEKTFDLLGNFTLDTEGWGLTYDGNYLIISDGTANLHFLDPTTYKTSHNITVHDANGPVKNLNELEYINGVIYANIWFDSKIAIINTSTGQVEAYIDLENLTQPYLEKNSNYVLNGIAYNTQTNQLYITGKNWPNLYEITILRTQ